MLYVKISPQPYHGLVPGSNLHWHTLLNIPWFSLVLVNGLTGLHGCNVYASHLEAHSSNPDSGSGRYLQVFCGFRQIHHRNKGLYLKIGHCRFRAHPSRFIILDHPIIPPFMSYSLCSTVDTKVVRYLNNRGVIFQICVETGSWNRLWSHLQLMRYSLIRGSNDIRQVSRKRVQVYASKNSTFLYNRWKNFSYEW
jgi:hypothetical protein